MWEQLNIAQTLDTKQIWILNVGDLKMLELPLEWFMNLAYDFDHWDRTSLDRFLYSWAKREFAADENTTTDIADIMNKYSVSGTGWGLTARRLTEAMILRSTLRGGRQSWSILIRFLW